jgi:hypothetical protein
MLLLSRTSEILLLSRTSEILLLSRTSEILLHSRASDPIFKGPSTLAFFASVSPSAITPPPNYFLCVIRYVIAREKQGKQLGSGAIADRETDIKTRVLIPISNSLCKRSTGLDFGL